MQKSFKLSTRTSHFSGIEQHLGEIESRDRVGGRNLDGPRKLGTSACVASANQSREFVRQAREHTQWPGGVISRVDTRRALKRTARAPCKGKSCERVCSLCLKREVDAEPEVSLDAMWLKTRGAGACLYTARVKSCGPVPSFFLLPQKKESTAHAPTDLEIIVGHRDAFELPDTGANHFYLLAPGIERVGAFDDRRNALFHKKDFGWMPRKL